VGLTDLFIKRQKPPVSGQKTYFDTDPKGFGIRISQGGTKTFVYKYGKARKLKTIGRYPEWSLTAARREAKRIQGEVLSLPSHSTTLPECTFAEARDRFLEDSEARTKPKTHEEYARLLHKHFAYNKELVDITRQDIMNAVSVLREKPSVEQHAYVAIRTMMNWCVRHGLLHVSPVPRLRFQARSRSRVLSNDELRLVWQRAEEVGYPYGTIVQLLILTGQRRGEIAALRASWIDDESIGASGL
jgi:integrase